jgi:hypothetical protein
LPMALPIPCLGSSSSSSGFFSVSMSSRAADLNLPGPSSLSARQSLARSKAASPGQFVIHSDCSSGLWTNVAAQSASGS